MIELPPVSGDHVGSNLELSGIFKLTHNLSAAVTGLGTAGILYVSDDPMHVLAEIDCLFKAPCTVGIDIHTCFGKTLLDSTYGLHLLRAPEHAAFELEVSHAVFFLNGFGLFHDARRGKDLLTPEAEPGIFAVMLVDILHISGRHLALIGDVEQITQHFHPVTLLAFAQKLAHGDFQILPQKIEHGALNSPLASYNIFELGDIQSLDTLSGVVGMGIDCLMDALKHFTALGDRCANHELAHGHKPVVGVVTAMDLADTGMAGRVFQNYQITREAGCVTAGERHQHTVKSRYGDDLHISYNRNAYFDLLL